MSLHASAFIKQPAQSMTATAAASTPNPLRRLPLPTPLVSVLPPATTPSAPPAPCILPDGPDAAPAACCVACPQLAQNFAPSGILLPHFEQNISRPPMCLI